MRRVVIGLDPGITGALSLFRDGYLVDVQDIPLVETKQKRKGAGIRDLIGGAKDVTRREVDIPALVALLRQWTEGCTATVYSEKVGPRPAQGIVSTTKFLRTLHLVEGVCATLGVPLLLVEPELWKRVTHTPTDKEGARRHAISNFPDWAPMLKRAKDHNRAESILIGMYGTLQN